jgi:hypothetical protein
MTTWQKRSLGVIVLTVILVIAYDFVARAFGGTEGTVSYVVTMLSYEYPIIPFCFGFLMGHFFFQLHGTIKQVTTRTAQRLRVAMKRTKQSQKPNRER